MKKIIKSVFLIGLFLEIGIPVSLAQNQPLPIIFDTDMGNDIDDALALDMLYKYMEDGKVDLLGITSNKNDTASIEYLDIMNNFYGFPDIPIGKITNGAESYRKNPYTLVVSKDKNYPRSHNDYSSFPESVDLMRKLLAKQKDNSVVIVAVGFSTNLSRLLNSKPDKYSSLSGKQLIKKKVKSLCMMAGDFSNDAKRREFNIRIDNQSAQNVFKNWPSSIITSPFEVGINILYPVSSILNDFTYVEKHPLVEGYKVYKPMPYDRPTWDLTAVLYAIEPEKGYFGCSGKGKIDVDNSAKTIFTLNKNGNRRYLTVNKEQQQLVLKRFLELITRKPHSIMK